jgi:hypothetical protein
MTMKQTAVEYIKEKLQGYGFDFGYVLDVAKEMEKEQIIEAYCNGDDNISADQYYNETYKQ